MVLIATAGSIWLDVTPAEVRVRVFSVRRLVAFSGIPLGMIASGLGGAALGYFFFLRILLSAVVLSLLVTWLMRWRRVSQRGHNAGAGSPGGSEA